MNQTINKKLFLIRWHQCLSYLNFTSLKRYLVHYNIAFIDNTKGYICNNCKKAKVTKWYNQTP